RLAPAANLGHRFCKAGNVASADGHKPYHKRSITACRRYSSLLRSQGRVTLTPRRLNSFRTLSRQVGCSLRRPNSLECCAQSFRSAGRTKAPLQCAHSKPCREQEPVSDRDRSMVVGEPPRSEQRHDCSFLNIDKKSY